MTAMQQLPLGQSGFSALRLSNAVYVDKTLMINELARNVGKFFLARPRRFGKSLLISTFESLFADGLTQFKGLAIEKLWTDQTYPVVRLDFSQAKEFASAEEFVCKFKTLLAAGFRKAGFSPSGTESVVADIADWLERLAPCSLVVLIDEYDSPLTACLDNADLFESVRLALSDFYLMLKSCDKALRFLFLTGITKYSSTNIFSGLNNVTDISLEPAYGTLLGYTQKEIEIYFADYLSKAAQVLNLEQEELLSELRDNYNGFCFDQLAQTSVYCPWSVLSFLRTPAVGFENYWYVSGGHPTVLLNYMSDHRLGDPRSFNEPVVIKLESLASPQSYNDMAPEVLLTQTGYLTIKKRLSRVHLLIGYPNQELYLSMGRLYAGELLRRGQDVNDPLAFWTLSLAEEN